MNWEAVSAIGELAAAIGVIFTLIYLAYQLKQNTAAVRSSTYEAYSQSSNAWSNFVAQHAKEIAEINKYSTIDDLPDNLRLIFVAEIHLVFNTWESTFLHYRAGALDEDVFAAKKRGFADAIRWQETGNLFFQAWERFSLEYCEDFQKFMDEEVIGPNSNT